MFLVISHSESKHLTPQEGESLSPWDYNNHFPKQQQQEQQ